MLKWCCEGPIRRQLKLLAILPILLVAVLAIIAEPFFPEISEVPYVSATAVKVAFVAEQVKNAPTPEAADTVLATAAASGLTARRVDWSAVAGEDVERVNGHDARRKVAGKLPMGLESFVPEATPETAGNFLIIRLDGDNALAFTLPQRTNGSWLTSEQAHIAGKLFLVVTPLLLLSIYASRMISRPLSRFAEAAETLKPDEGPDRPFAEEGALEMKQLARALNEMRSRVRRMIDDRTRMLRAISHDLRTPLTRLRLRAERSNQPELRAAILADVASLGDMIEDTLSYLSNDTRSEPVVRSDLPSLIGTVCADFSDMGHDVAYDGPERLAYGCKPRSLARAVTNLVDNASKFGTTVRVSLKGLADGSVEIAVADDGPGLPKDLRQKVLEPFFKADTARTATDRSGFGLGLSIVDDIVRGHGGVLSLADGVPSGLVVTMVLPAENRQQQPVPGRQKSGSGRRAMPAAATTGR